MEDILQQIALPLIAVVVPLIVALVKMVVPKIPSWLIPILAGPLGYGVEWFAAWAAGYEGAGLTAVLVGLAGVGVREVYHQSKKALAGA